EVGNLAEGKAAGADQLVAADGDDVLIGDVVHSHGAHAAGNRNAAQQVGVLCVKCSERTRHQDVVQRDGAIFRVNNAQLRAGIGAGDLQIECIVTKWNQVAYARAADFKYNAVISEAAVASFADLAEQKLGSVRRLGERVVVFFATF